MVRRFPYLGNYPDRYSPQRPGELTDLPSQQNPVPPPFDPSQHPDTIKQPPPLQLDLSIVRYVMDSRPPFAWDFYWQEFNLDTGGNVPIVGGQIQQTVGYNVPDGYTLLLRSVGVEFDTIETQNATFLAGPLNDFGTVNPGLWPLMSLQCLVNNSAAQGWPPQSTTANNQTVAGGIPLPDIYTDDIEVPCFIVVPGGSNVRAQIKPSFAGFDPSTNNALICFSYHGTMLFSTGRETYREVGNADPLLTRNLQG